MSKSAKHNHIESFNLQAGRILSKKYEVISLLGVGWEGEVYKVKERNTGIERAAKLFYPQRNPKNKTSIQYARKLHKLCHCPIVIQYHAEEQFTFKSIEITALISELVEGEILKDFIKRQPGKRLSPFQAVHLLHSLCVGLENIHHVKEYHGDLHSENIIVAKYGLTFDLKLLDFFHWKTSTSQNLKDDICDAIGIFHSTLGGQKHYSKLPDEIKYICSGLKKSIILKKFPRISALKTHLETMQWN